MSRLAAKQFGVVTLDQLLAAGLTKQQVRTWRMAGHLHPLHRGVFAVGHRRIVDHGHLVAALMAAGARAFLSHRTAAAVWGLRQLAPRHIEVTIPGKRAGRRANLEIHRTSAPPPESEVRVRNGLRVSSVPRLLVELAVREPPEELDRLITEAARKSILDVFALDEALVRHAHRPGIAKLRAAFTAYRPGPDRKSSLERAFDALLARTPDIPPPQRNITILAGGIAWEIDCYWPEQRVAVELDGRTYHQAQRDMEKDRLKDAKLLTIGVRPLRISDRRLDADVRGALNDLRVLLGLSVLAA